MESKVNAQTSSLLKQEGVTLNRLQVAMEQLATGNRLLRPGTDTVDFGEVSQWRIDLAENHAQIRVGQNRLAWYQVSVEYLQSIRETLTEMAALAGRALGSDLNANDRAIVDEQFQAAKQRLSAMVDGAGGKNVANASFQNIPLFLGISPPVSIGHDVSVDKDGNEALNLYTAFTHAGFSVLPLWTAESQQGDLKPPPLEPVLTGTAVAASSTTITLQPNAATEDGIYDGFELFVTGGTGEGQRVVISDYDGSTRIATFAEELGIALDATSEYEIKPLILSPTLTGTADAGSTSSITLARAGSSAIENVYTGMQIQITDGAGEGQVAVIDSYDPENRVATFKMPLGTALDSTSQYTIYSGRPNDALIGTPTDSSVRFASDIWGADNYRLDRLNDDHGIFISVTEEERLYREQNSIPDTDLNAYTYGEKMARRQLNIFDPEFGGLNNPENAQRMLQQVNRAIDQMAVAITREAAKGANLKSQFDFYTAAGDALDQGIKNLSETNFVSVSSSLAKLQHANEIFAELGMRLNETFQKLNQLVVNRGAR